MIKKILLALILIPFVGFSIYIGMQTFHSKEEKIDYAGLTRKYRIHYPKGFSTNKEYPLVIALHGYMDDARLMEIYTGLSRKADAEGFVVVYPYGHKKNFVTPPSWNAFFCCAWSFENNVDDLGFVEAVLNRVVGKGGIDESKVYLIGVSNGGMLANHLALKISDRISGVATIASAVGAKYEEDEEFTYLEKTYNPVPILIIHGKEDKTVPFNGGEGKNRAVEFTGAYDTLNFWLENNKCNKHPSEVSNQAYITSEFYNDCENSKVEFYAIDTKHTWPGSVHDLIPYISGKSLKATDLIWEFFTDVRK